MRRAFLAFNGLVLAFLLAPVVLVVLFAINPQPFISFPPTGISLRWYVKFFNDRALMGAFAFSLELAAATAVIAGSIGTAAALALSRGGLPGRAALISMFLSPLVLPALLTGFAMFQLEQGLVGQRPDLKLIPNAAHIYPYAMSDKIVGIAIFTSAIGLAWRRDQVKDAPVGWADFWKPELAGKRGAYVIPANSLGQSLFMMAGRVFGSGYKDVDASFKAMEALKPVRLYDFTGGAEAALVSGELAICELHDTAAYRHMDDVPIEFTAPKEGVMALEQVLSVTKGTTKSALAHEWINYMLSPEVQKGMAEEVWYSPVRDDITLAPKFAGKLLTTPAQVATLIQLDWRWYNEQKDTIDDRVNRIFRG